MRRNGIVSRCEQGSVTDVTSHSTLDVNVLGSPRSAVMIVLECILRTERQRVNPLVNIMRKPTSA